MRKTALFVFIVIWLLYSPCVGAEVSFESGPGQTVLMELFTSEGCSSCPPADEWMSGLKESPYLWKSFVPVAFHVDYWDYTGWKDPLGSPENTSRQKKYVSLWKSDSVYTPMIVNNGKELRDWYLTPTLKIKGRTNAGTLKIRQTQDGEFEVTYLPYNGKFLEHVWVAAAYLGCGVIVDVESGENRGKTFRHDFAALSFMTKEMGYEGGALKSVIRLDTKRSAAASRHAIAVWVSQKDSTEPLQAVGGYLD